MSTIKKRLQELKRRHFAPPYDSEKHDAENFYSQQYLHHIRRHLDLAEQRPMRILDAGCGTGRLAMALARDGHHVTAIDVSRPSLALLREKADAENLDLVTVEKDVHELGQDFIEGFDCVMSIEVLYTSESREAVTRQLLSCLKAGGLAFITHKPSGYFLLSAIKAKRFDEAHTILSGSEGELRKGPYTVHYNWQTVAQIQALYDRENVSLLATVPIGAFSGFSVDPMASVCDPASLDDDEREALLKLELEADDSVLAISRYILAIVKKPD